MDSEDGVSINPSTNLTFESDFLLGQDLDFSDADNSKILGLEKFSGEWLAQLQHSKLIM